VPLTILLADDSMTAQKMGKEILVGAGYEVIAVSNGAAAAKKLADKPDIAILDIIMPGYSGLEICEKIRASMETSKTPVLLTVGKMEHYDPQDVARVKADGVIIKPFEATDLLATIKKFEQKLAAAAAPPESAYEKTMILDRAQIQEFKDASYDEWKTDAPSVEEMEVSPPPMEMSQEEASAPAFADMMGSPSATSMDETVTIPPPAKAAAAAASFDETVTFPPIASPMDETVTFPPGSPMMDAAAPPPLDFSAPAVDFAPPAIDFAAIDAPPPMMMEPVAAAPATASEVEFTSAPRGLNAKVVIESGLEADHVEVAQVMQDPALVTDPTTMATEFATKFGVEKEEEGGYVPGFEKPEEEIAPIPVSTADDDFEARVAAAMNSFEAPAEVEAPAIEDAAPIEGNEIPAPIEVAEIPPPIEVAPEVAAVEAPGHIDTQEMAAVVEEVAVEPELDPSQLPPEGMQDAALVEQMQQAFADLPVAPPAPPEEPIAEAPVMAAPEPVAAPVASSGITHPDMELANALAAAVGAEPPPPQTPNLATPVAAAAAAGAPGLDPHTVAAVVSRVMERMLPSIMTEVAKELDNAKK
jgi:CheY-like chemotaxis protein